MTRNPIRRRALALVVATGAVASLTGCGGDGLQSDAPTVEVVLGDYTISPNALTIDTGDVDLHVTNTGATTHNLTLAGKGTRNLAPGAEQTLTVNIAAGTYNMWCDVPGHAAMGQTGTLQVVEPVAATATT
jgi:Cupredoxin-like domain